MIVDMPQNRFCSQNGTHLYSTIAIGEFAEWLGNILTHTYLYTLYICHTLYIYMYMYAYTCIRLNVHVHTYVLLLNFERVWKGKADVQASTLIFHYEVCIILPRASIDSRAYQLVLILSLAQWINEDCCYVAPILIVMIPEKTWHLMKLFKIVWAKSMFISNCSVIF